MPIVALLRLLPSGYVPSPISIIKGKTPPKVTDSRIFCAPSPESNENIEIVQQGLLADITQKAFKLQSCAGTSTAGCFAALTATTPCSVEHQTLDGMLGHAQNFPGWESSAGLSAPLNLIRGHHREIVCIALVTGSILGTVAPAPAKHVVSA